MLIGFRLDSVTGFDYRDPIVSDFLERLMEEEATVASVVLGAFTIRNGASDVNFAKSRPVKFWFPLWSKSFPFPPSSNRNDGSSSEVNWSRDLVCYDLIMIMSSC